MAFVEPQLGALYFCQHRVFEILEGAIAIFFEYVFFFFVFLAACWYAVRESTDDIFWFGNIYHGFHGAFGSIDIEILDFSGIFNILSELLLEKEFLFLWLFGHEWRKVKISSFKYTHTITSFCMYFIFEKLQIMYFFFLADIVCESRYKVYFKGLFERL